MVPETFQEAPQARRSFFLLLIYGRPNFLPVLQPKHITTNMRIQLSSMKADIQRDLKNVNQSHCSHYNFLCFEKYVVFFIKYDIYVNM